MTGGRPSLIASWFCQYGRVMQIAACSANAGLGPYFEIPMLAPPTEERPGTFG